MNNHSLLFKHKCICTKLDELSADAFLFTSQPNIVWSTGVNADDGFVIVTKNQIYLIVDKRSFSYIKKHLNKQINLVEFKSVDSIKQIINLNTIKKLIIENDYLTFQQYDQYVKPLKVQTIKFDTKQLRIIKCKEELEYLQKAADIAVKAIEQTRKWLKPGVTEIETKQYLHNYMIKHGASDMSFDLIVCFGKNTANPHHKAGGTKLHHNELVTLDIGCIYNNYCSDITRTFFVGNKPSKETVEMYELVKQAQQLGLNTVAVGMKGSTVDAVVRDYISKNPRFGKLFSHGLGHGVGLEIHELPNLNFKYNETLPNNCVVTIEPGVYEDNFGGVRIEDTIVVTNKGIINLTHKARKDFYQ